LEGTHNYDMDRHTRLIYHPISGLVYRRRFVLAVDLLARHCDPQARRVAEIGYGAGLLFPTLAQMAKEVVGVDLMDTRASAAVGDMLRRLGVDNVGMLKGSVLSIPLTNSSLDGLLCLSVLEHLHNADEMGRAAKEMARVLSPRGVAVLGFPVKNKITKLLFKIIGYNDDEIHPSSHTDILGGYSGPEFELLALRRFPSILPLDFTLYAVAVLRKRSENGRPEAHR
jgi:2-polyprenyl-3-methyl-5-hydroxy-6-metoxy-1,4-benzoquinol methylase